MVRLPEPLARAFYDRSTLILHALMADDLTRIPFAIRLSRQTLAIIKQNIWFSITVKAVFMVLANTGWATLWMAVAADMGASLAVIANGLRTLRVRDQ
jgi:Cd2+/Zn2+-exporting ATPase